MGIVTHTFLDKSNTIVKDDSVNLGLNPIMEICQGSRISRGILHIDLTKIKEMVEDKTYPYIDLMSHKLHLQNVGGLSTPYTGVYNQYNNAKRAKSFDLDFYLIDNDWDMGGGFDYLKDGFDTVNRVYSTDGSNWLNKKTNVRWGTPGVINFDNVGPLISQHFDLGNESISIDLTDIINFLIDLSVSEEQNKVECSLLVKFKEEKEDCDELTYVGFFTEHTHTFYQPYLETTYNDYIYDDRINFYLNKDNKLYFYSNIKGDRKNLDELPICSINGKSYTVQQATKGVYYVVIPAEDSKDYDVDTMYYDTWSNIKYNGVELPDTELYFTTKSNKKYYQFGLPYETSKQVEVIPSLCGINHRERIIQGDIRKVNILPKIAYSTQIDNDIEVLFYRLYSMNGEGEVTVIDWTPVEHGYNENYFLIDTNSLVPGDYYISIKYVSNMEERIFRNLSDFTIQEKNLNIN